MIRTSITVLSLFLLSASGGLGQDQTSFSIEDILSPGFPSSLVSARHANRIAWIENERGMRNVYTATPPEYDPVRLTSYLEDDGVDLTGLQISDDGKIVTFIRGHAPNREGWVANPTSNPRGGERVVWAMGTDGGNPWRVVAMRDYELSPDGRWVLYVNLSLIHI